MKIILFMNKANSLDSTIPEIVFFFGSGISLKSGGPTTSDITRDITKFSYEGRERARLISLVKSFLESCNNDSNQSSDRVINYEDIYGICDQLNQYHASAARNIAIKPLFSYIKHQFIQLIPEENASDVSGDKSFLTALKGTCEFIKNAVLNRLYPVNKPKGLDALLEIVQDYNIQRVSIFTLNHDLLLESLFENNHIEYEDGFHSQNSNDDTCLFDGNRFFNDTRIKLFKLHGSINWREFQTHYGNREIRKISRDLIDIDHCKDQGGKWLEPLNSGALFLSGTFTKELEYIDFLHITLFFNFCQTLRRTKRLFVSGYGFGDGKINQIMAQWLLEDTSRRVILLHNDAINCLNGIRNGTLKFSNQFIDGRKYLQDCTKRDIEAYLNDLA